MQEGLECGIEVSPGKQTEALICVQTVEYTTVLRPRYLRETPTWCDDILGEFHTYCHRNCRGARP